MFGKKNSHPHHRSDFFLGEMERETHRPAKEKKPPSAETEASSLTPKTAEKKISVPMPSPKTEPAPVAEPASVVEPAPVAEPASVVEPASAVEPASKAEEKNAEPAPKKERPARRAARDAASLFSRALGEKAAMKSEKTPRKQSEKATLAKEKAPTAKEGSPAKEDSVAQSLDGMYDVHRDPARQKKKPLTAWDVARYAVLFCCIFGFLFAGYFVFGKLYDYYRTWQVNTELQDLIEKKDLFADDYMKKLAAAVPSLTPQDILNGKTAEGEGSVGGFSAEQENILSKIAQLKNINSDTVGWITIEGTVVNYPVVWSSVKNYYLHRDFYKKPLSGGTIYVDERNSPKLSENRNTVFYGHNMSDGSMFASLHDFQSATLFFDATIQLATSEGIFIYKPFSVHQADAYDNYFETNFQNDSDFIQFCEDMQFLSIFETEYTFTENSRIITLSTCMDNESATDERFAVHAVLTQVIR